MKSITFKVMLVIGIVIFVMAVFLISLTYSSQKKSEIAAYDSQVNSTQQVTAAALAEAVYVYDTVQINTIIASIVKYNFVEKISVTDHRGKPLSEATSGRGGGEQTSVAMMKLMREGENVGTAEITFVQDHLQGYLNRLLVNYIIGGAIIVIAILLTIYYLLRWQITRPLSKISGAMKNIGAGDADLTKRLAVQGDDEIAHIAFDFNVFAEKIQQVVKSVSGTTEHVSYALRDLMQCVVDTKDCVQQQRQESTHVATAVTELAASAKSVADSVTQNSQHTESATQQLKAGQEQLSVTFESLKKLDQSMKDGANTIFELKEKTGDITKILDVIRGVAEQINLLALNAAIEAARAGEHGRGFAVVADEVRTLANKTHDSTQEITALLAFLLDKTNASANTMSDSRKIANTTLKNAQETSETLRHTVENVFHISEMNRDLAEIAQNQSATLGEVSDNANNISNLAERTESSTVQIDGIAAGLEEKVDALTHEVKRFTF